MKSLIAIILIWIASFYTMGFNGFSIFFAVLGTLIVGASINGWNKAKGDAYLASKFDESKRQ